MPSKLNLYNKTSFHISQHMLFSGVRRITAPRWQGFNSQQLHILWPTLRSATPSNFCRPATPTGSLLFAAPRPERPSDPANPGARPALVGEAQCHAKWPRGGRDFQHSSDIEPTSPNSLRLTLTAKPDTNQWLSKPLVRINCPQNTQYDLLYFAICTRFFAYRTVVLG